MRRRFGFFGLTAFVLGCNAILGIESGEFDPPVPALEAGAEAGSDTGTDAPSDTGATDARPNLPDAGHDADADAEAPDTGADADADADANAPIDAGEDAEAGACDDLLNDPKNCGTCGHDCFGGACFTGVCQPYIITDINANDLVSLAISDTNVFWTNATTNKLQTAGQTMATAPVETVLTLAPDTFADRIASAGGQIYFGQHVTADDSWRVARVGQNDREVGSQTIAEHLTELVSEVRADSATNIVWNEVQPSGQIHRCTTIPCPTPDTLGTDDFPTTLAIGNGMVAWSTLLTKNIRVVTGASAPAPVGMGLNTIAAMMLLPGSLIYSDLSRGVLKINLTDQSETSFVADKNVTSIALDPDGTTVWYLNTNSVSGTSKLVHVSSSGGATVPVRTDLGTPRALAVDASRVYWLDTVSGHDRVMAIAK